MKVCMCPNHAKHANIAYVASVKNGVLTWEEDTRAVSQSEFVGVDGSRCGWFSVGLDRSRKKCELKAFRYFDRLLDYYSTAKLILVDIPIGSPDGPDERVCDKLARSELGHPRGTSVFRTPTRQTVRLVHSGANYRQACAKEKAITNKKISKQAFAISGKIHEVDRCMVGREHGIHPTVREVHPEVCFWALRKKPMVHRKGAKPGISERVDALQHQDIEPKAKKVLDAACSKFFRKCVARDDIIDALVAAVTAREGSLTELDTLPEIAPTDEKGLPMEMVYWPPKRGTED